ncbi:MAG: mechanosensitive ion channel [Myxococcales bacterium]|nr:mechanosensitive ion channel [Myxococcales bacterium]
MTALVLAGLALTLIVSIVLGWLARRAIQRLAARRDAGSLGVAYAIGRIAQYVVVISGVLLGLDNVGFSLATLATFGAVLTVGVGFGLQNITQNFISGLILLLERPVQRGDFVVVGDLVGRVEEIALRATTVISRDGVAVIVPNSSFITATVVNLTAGARAYRARIKVGVAYDADLPKVRRVLLSIATARAEVLDDPTPQVFFRDFGDSALDLELTFWMPDPSDEPRLTSEMRFAIMAAFREHGIEVPFPQRDVRIRHEVRVPGPSAPS